MKTFKIMVELEFELPDSFEISSSQSALKYNKRLFFPEIKWTNASGLEAENRPVELRLPTQERRK
jgi:hypothetical protein